MARICVIGAGPAGFAVTEKILKSCAYASINIVDRNFSPFGLLRYGVAPDNIGLKILANDSVKFFGGLHIGLDISLSKLSELHDAVVICTGAPIANKLRIPGELLKNSISAAQFVGWYNGDPAHARLPLDLETCQHVTIIGLGNVALDVARTLISPMGLLEKTDMPVSVLQALAKSKVRDVTIMGRRGPLQSSFTIAEFRQTTSVPGVSLDFETDSVLSDLKRFEQLWSTDRRRARLLRLMENRCTSSAGKVDGGKSLRFRFGRRPAKFGLGKDGEFMSLDVERMIPMYPIEPSLEKILAMKYIDSGVREMTRCDLLISCLGFHADQGFGLETTSAGTIVNELGRVIKNPKLYVSGWAAIGAIGQLASTLDSASVTVKSVLEDLGGHTGTTMVRECLEHHLETSGLRYFTKLDWATLERQEHLRGLRHGKCREKITDRFPDIRD